jgi:hypothetical protein
MSNRLTGAILLLYPGRVRKAHGPEIVALIDDLIAHEGRSRTGLFIRLTVDGVVQRLASTATVWTVAAVLMATSFGGLAVSEFAAASAPHVVPRSVHTVAPTRHTNEPRPPAPTLCLRQADSRALTDKRSIARPHEFVCRTRSVDDRGQPGAPRLVVEAGAHQR